MLLSRELGRALRGLDARGIPAIVLKGQALAETLYRHPAMRPYHDLDLLVPPRHRFEANHVLLALGYRLLAEHSRSFDVEREGATTYEARNNARVDLHWRLLTEPRNAWNEAEEASVWARAVPIQLAGTATLTLSDEDLLLYLAVHLAVHHSLAGLLWHWDLALLLERRGATLDWETLVERARRWRVCRAVFFALAETGRAFGAQLPPGVMRRLAPGGPRAMALARLLARADAARRAQLEYLVPLLLADRARDVARALATAAWPPPAWLHARYGATAPSRLGQYLAHCRRLASIAGATTVSLVSRRGSHPG